MADVLIRVNHSKLSHCFNHASEREGFEFLPLYSQRSPAVLQLQMHNSPR